MASLLEQLASGYTAPRVNQSILNQLTAPQTTGELRSYSPPIRQRIIDALIGDNRPSQAKRNFIEGLVGLSDWTPMGAVYGLDEAQRALRAGNTQQAQLNLAGAIPIPAAKGAVKAAQAGIRAYHGSPHDFDRFDITKIGTGEGAQAYGHGLYFAENPNVAASYKLLAPPPSSPTPLDVSAAIRSLDNLGFNSPGSALTQIRANPDWMKRWDVNPSRSPNEASAAKAINDYLAANPRGHMYEVNINARPEQFLDWDKPLSQQPRGVQLLLDEQINKLKNSGNIMMPSYMKQYESGTLPGSMIYSGVRSKPEQATQAFAEAGIPGIRYLDQGSRGTGQGTSNYVLFNDNLIDILRKYGLAGATATGAIAGATQAPSGDVY